MLTVLDITDKDFRHEFRGYKRDEVDEFLELIADDYATLVRQNRQQEQQIRELEEKLNYFGNMKDSLTQSVILAQETADKLKASAQTDSDQLLRQAQHDANQLVEHAKQRAKYILNEASEDAKRVAIETEELKRQSRTFHQRLQAMLEGQLGLVNSPEWQQLLQPTTAYLQNSDVAFREVVEQALSGRTAGLAETVPADATRQFSPEEIAELNRRMEEANAKIQAAEQNGYQEQFSGETQTFKLNI